MPDTQHIRDLKENIRRLEYTLAQKFWDQGYLRNCARQLEFYKQQLNQHEQPIT